MKTPLRITSIALAALAFSGCTEKAADDPVGTTTAVEEDSDVLHHASDDMTKHKRDASIRGKTNQFLLKLRKPE